METNKKRKKITARDKIQERKESRLSKKVKFDEKQRHFSKKLRGGGRMHPAPLDHVSIYVPVTIIIEACHGGIRNMKGICSWVVTVTSPKIQFNTIVKLTNV